MKAYLFWASVTLLLLTGGSATQYTISAQPRVPKELRLADVEDLTLSHNPSLATFATELLLQDATIRQARMISNPEVGVEFENFMGPDAPADFEGVETSVSLSQLVEVNGKRWRKKQVASLGKESAEWEFQSKKQDLLASMEKTFIEVLISQEQVILQRELLNIATQTAKSVTEKVNAGTVSPIEKSRVQIERATTGSETSKAIRDWEANKRKLAAFWGSDSVTFTSLTGNVYDIKAIPSEDSLKILLEKNPDLIRSANEITRSKAALSLARAESVPGLTLSAGYKKETDKNTFSLGVGLPLPLFSRNQGNIAEMRTEVEKSYDEQREQTANLRTELSNTWHALSAIYTEVYTLQNEILPAAEKTFSATEIGYREGKFNFLQMLDAQRMLFTLKRQYLSALGVYHNERIDIESIVGISFDEIQKYHTEETIKGVEHND